MSNCDGSGKMSHICSTLVPHQHCAGPVREIGIISTRSIIEVGDCWDYILDDSDLCELCTKKANGAYIHSGTTLLRESRTGMVAENHSGTSLSTVEPTNVLNEEL